MVLNARYFSLLATCLTVAAGCQSTLWTQPAATELVQADGMREGALIRDSSTLPAHPSKPEQTSPTVTQTASTSTSSATPPASAESAANTRATHSDDYANDAVLRELQIIGAVDPAAAQKLVERLQTTKASLRPLVAEQFRASWEYHREFTGQLPSSAPSSPAYRRPPESSVMPHSSAEPTPSRELGGGTAAFDASSYNPADFASPNPMPIATSKLSATPARPNAEEMPTAEPRSAAASLAANKSAGGSTRSRVLETAGLGHVMQANYEARPLSGESSDVNMPAGGDWTVGARRAIEQLGNAVASEPRSTAEAYQHVRLRLMQLAAGDKMEALQPIPGLTPTEQAYWSNQLFTIATLLDHKDIGDDAQRASLAGDQLAVATAKLGELATLSVRNLTFCEQVYGFGDCERKDPAKFKIGDEVTLYAEIENFRSESTEKGHHTSLATSYEVLDKHGNRVEEGEFATVDDYCGRTRRDFYIEYTFALPKRIYPNEYQLKLMIRDRLSGKIGQAIVDFEIAE